MWGEKEKKKGLYGCVAIALAFVFVSGLIIVSVYSFFFTLFSSFGSSGTSLYGMGDGTYRFPLHGEIHVNSPFNLNRVLPEIYGDNDPHPHYGTDFRAPHGTKVLAARDGVVADTYESYEGGVTVVIDHGGGEVTRYLHLSNYVVSIGQVVSQGQHIANSGNSGAWTTGAHLHFEIRSNGVAIDAMTVLTSW